MSNLETVTFEIHQPEKVGSYQRLIKRAIDFKRNDRAIRRNSRATTLLYMQTDSNGTLPVFVENADTTTMAMNALGVPLRKHVQTWESLFDQPLNREWPPMPAIECRLETDEDIAFVICVASIARR